VSGSLYDLLRLWCLGVCIVYYVYGVWESVCSITSMVSGSLYVLLRLWCLGVCMLYYVYGIDVIEHTDFQTP
jgi:hypothetical protein